MAKQYKPGQFVWIKGKKYRITKGSNNVGICWQCQFGPYSVCPVNKWCIRLPRNCYPKPV